MTTIFPSLANQIVSQRFFPPGWSGLFRNQHRHGSPSNRRDRTRTLTYFFLLISNRTAHTHTLSDSGRKIFSLLYFREPRPDSSLPHSTELAELLALNPREGFRGQQSKILEILLRNRVFLLRDDTAARTRAQQGDFRPNLGTRRIPERARQHQSPKKQEQRGDRPRKVSAQLALWPRLR